MEGREPESFSSVKEGGKSHRTNIAALGGHIGGSHLSRKRPAGQNLSREIKHIKK